MTPDELRALADEATPGPWYVEHGARALFISSHNGPIADLEITGGAISREPADARLIALAPDLARLCAEYAGALAQIEKLHHKDFDLAPQIAHRALAKLSELKPVT